MKMVTELLVARFVAAFVRMKKFSHAFDNLILAQLSLPSLWGK